MKMQIKKQFVKAMADVTKGRGSVVHGEEVSLDLPALELEGCGRFQIPLTLGAIVELIFLFFPKAFFRQKSRRYLKWHHLVEEKPRW